MDIIPALQTGTQVIVYAPHAAREESAVLAAQLALRGSLTILDGGNRFQAYPVAHLIRRQTTNVCTAADRLFIRRAFTCYQMLSLLENTLIRPQPYLILDLLATFYDDHVQTHEANRLLDACLAQLERLRRAAPVAITLAPPLLEERAFLVQRVCAQADTLFTLELPEPQPCQPELL
jgi:hypothetical protein